MAEDNGKTKPKMTPEQSEALQTELDCLPADTGAACSTDAQEELPSLTDDYVRQKLNYEIVGPDGHVEPAGADSKERNTQQADDSMITSMYVRETYEIVERQRVILLIGKTGNGKSTVGNILLGEKKFRVGRGMSSTTVHSIITSMPEKDCALKVVDTPDINNMDLTEEDKKAEVLRWKELSKPGPHVILLAIRCDVRYTAEEYDIYKEIKRLWGEEEEFKRLLVVGFTYGDRQDKDIAEELETVCDELKNVLKDADNKYVVIDGTASSEEKAQVTEQVKERDLEKCDEWIVNKPGMLGYLVSFIPWNRIHLADFGFRYVLRPLQAGCGYLLSFPTAAVHFCAAQVLGSSTHRLGITSNSGSEGEERTCDEPGDMPVSVLN